MREYADIYSSSAREPALFQDVWRYRELLRNLVLRDLKVKYQRSVFGFVWTLLNPLITIGVLVVVFSVVIRLPVPDYWAFLISGYFTWNFLSQSIATGTYVLAQHAALRRSVAYPDEVMILSATASRFFEFLMELALVLIALAVLHHGGLPPSFGLVPVLFLLQVLIAVGIMMPIATMSVFYHDVQHMAPVVLLMLFYISPVFYPAAMVPENLRDLFMLNPFAGLLTLYHVVLYHGEFPSLTLFGGVSAAAVVILVLGHAIFRRHKPTFAEIA